MFRLRRRILQGTLALTAAGLYSRLTGTVYRVLLVRIVGEAGIGLFQMALPIFGLAINLATLGLPAALATVVAERAAHGDWPGVEQARRIVTRTVLAASLAAAALTWFGSDLLARFVLTDTRTAPSLAVMAPAIVAASLAMVLRGFFQGLHDLVPGAAAQMVEQTVRIVTVLALAAVLLPAGLEAAAAGAMIGTACGEVAGLGVLLMRRRRMFAEIRPWRRPGSAAQPACTDRELTLRLLRLAIPVMLAGLAGSLTATADVIIIPRRLADAGFSRDQATALFGQLTGMALPLLFLPMVAVYPLMTSLMPAISSAAAHGDRTLLRSRIRLGIRLTLAVALPASLAFVLLPGQLAGLLYGNEDIAPLVMLLALAAPVTYVQHMEDAILTGLGLTAPSLFNYLMGIAVRLGLIYFLTGNPVLGIDGALLGIIGGQTVMAALHAREIRKATGIYPLP